MDDDRFRPFSDDEREQSKPPTNPAGEDEEWDPIVPIPDTVTDPDMHHWILGDPAAVRTYRDKNGDRVCFIGRYNKADGDKEFRPRTWQNIEEEMLTRLMSSDADESQKQTVNVLAAALTDDEDDKGVRVEIEQWLDYQRLLALDAPYDVVIPFRRAILRAILARQKAAEERGEKPKFRLRIRRDIHGFMTAVRTSAILHKAQREKDSRGRIVATIGDYEHAHEAFDPGLASLYKIVSPLTTIAVVRAIEEMGATASKAVKVTVTTLMEKLGITGRGVANDRLRDAEERGYIELVDKPSGYGKTTPREYKLVKYAVEIENEPETRFGSGVFPSPEAVEAELKIFSEEEVSPRYSGTDGTRSASDPNCTVCTTVPEGDQASEKNFMGGESAPKAASCTDYTNRTNGPAADPSSNNISDNPREAAKPPPWSLELEP
jgi:hypothetical protein